MIKYLVSNKDGNHMPYTDASGKPDHHLMGAAWAALHEGYRGTKYQGANKADALKKLSTLYKSEGMTAPQESFDGFSAGQKFVENGIPQSASFEAIRDKVSCSLQAQVKMEAMQADPMDCDDCYCWISNLYSDRVVYSYDGSYYMRDYSLTGDQVTFGPASQVEQSWQVTTPAQESNRVMLAESAKSGSSYDATTGLLTMTIIKPGFNKSKERYYPADMLRRDHKIFEGAKMFADHQTDQESKNRPEGSLRNWVGTVKKTWSESDGTIKGQAQVIDPPFKAKCEELAKQSMLPDLGVSIRAIGRASRQEVDGQATNYVESFLLARSVDFVTFAGAGGQVEAMESDPGQDVDLISEAQLRERRPDLVELIESRVTAGHEEETMKPVEQQLQESQASNAVLTAKVADLEKQITESAKAVAKTAVAAELTKQLTEAKLPKVAEDRIRKQFAEAEKADGIPEAITAEKDYIKAITPGAGVKNMGEADNGGQAAGENKVDLVESFKSMGLTEEEAKIAAKKK